MEIQLKQVPKKWHKTTYADVVTEVLAEVDSDVTISKKKKRTPGNRRRPLMISSGVALFAYGVLFIAWTGHRVDRDMRAEAMLQAQMVAQAVDFDRVAALSGSSADLVSADYQRLKEQLTLIRKANPKCRFIYLMGRNPAGALFFYVDSEDPDSPDYSPPGETFDEATKDDYAVFATGEGSVGGPYKDRWGTWISAMVPVFRPDGTRMPVVLGMDFNAISWKWDVSSKTMLPASPALLAFILGFYLLGVAFRPPQS
jgi:hypothetical protein